MAELFGIMNLKGFAILNIAPHEGFDHIISWNWDDQYCKSFQIHDTEQFEQKVWPKYSYGTHHGGVDRFYQLLNHFRFNVRGTDGSYYNDMFCKDNISECIALCRMIFHSKKNKHRNHSKNNLQKKRNMLTRNMRSS